MKNHFLEGTWAPVRDEITAGDLTVVGHLPTEIDGMFVRIGPNPAFAPLGRYHFFDGDGMMHGVRLQQGRASYRNRYVRTRAFLLEREAGKALWSGLLDPLQIDLSPQSIFPLKKKNPANTALVWHAGRLLALSDAGEPYEITLPDLSTQGPHTFDGALTFPFASHPKVDPHTGEMMIFGTMMRPRGTLGYGVVSNDGHIVHTAHIPLSHRTFSHDVALTERYVLFPEPPLLIEPKRVADGQSLYHFAPDVPIRFGVLPRRGSGEEIRWFERPACFIAHVGNAWEEGETIVLYANRADSARIGREQLEGVSTYPEPPRLVRLRFDLKSGECTEEKVDDTPIEFLFVPEAHVGRRSRYLYASRMLSEGVFQFDGVVKFDLEENTVSSHVFAPGCTGGAAAFAPRPGGSGPDDGWLVTFVHDGGTNQSELCVLDARDLGKGPVARVLLPRRVPSGVHSLWLTAEQLREGGEGTPRLPKA